MKIKRKQPQADVPSMAMGDIAFNLLIFFVILARAQDDRHLQWEPAQVTEVQNSGAAKVSLVIDSKNKYHINGKQVGAVQLTPIIKSLLGNAPAGERIVLLKVHKSAPAMFFEPAIEAISEAGGDMVHILEQTR